jgi:CRISPR-associated protein Cmr6
VTVRDVLRDLDKTPDHVGLAYEVWAPTGSDGKIPDDKSTGWLKCLAKTQVSKDYVHAFERWKMSLAAAPRLSCIELQLTSRLLVGHGNGSVTDVGLTVHRTWGTPVIPGSALKGVASHYMHAHYDNDDVCRLFFGTQEIAGDIVFHDGMYVPGSASGSPYAIDVLTVHQKTYYDTQGDGWPNDYDNPNPVQFLTVRPGTRFLIALTGSPELTELAERVLLEALCEWGVGGKKSSGYGRLERPADAAGATRTLEEKSEPSHKPGERVIVTRVDDPRGKGRVWLQADDGFGGVAPQGCPLLEFGQTIEVEINNINTPPGYNFRMPVQKK